MTSRLTACALAVLFAGVAAAAEIKSGPQVGETVPGPFEPLNLTGDAAGEEKCLYCKFGNSPVAVVFATDLTPNVKKLIKKIDAANAEHKGMGSYVVLTTECNVCRGDAKELAKKENIQHTILSAMAKAPKDYNISPDAEVTVVLYNKGKVKANHAFKKGEMCEKCVEEVVADVAKITK